MNEQAIKEAAIVPSAQLPDTRAVVNGLLHAPCIHALPSDAQVVECKGFFAEAKVWADERSRGPTVETE